MVPEWNAERCHTQSRLAKISCIGASAASDSGCGVASLHMRQMMPQGFNGARGGGRALPCVLTPRLTPRLIHGLAVPFGYAAECRRLSSTSVMAAHLATLSM